MRKLLSYGLVGLLAATLALKVTHSTPASTPEATQGLTGQLRAALEANGYLVAAEQPFDDYPMLIALKRTCVLKAAIVVPQGWATNLLRRTRAAEETLVYLFDGRLYDDHPLWPALWARAADRIGAAIGGERTVRPVVAFIGGRSCRVEPAEWAAMRKV